MKERLTRAAGLSCLALSLAVLFATVQTANDAEMAAQERHEEMKQGILQLFLNQRALGEQCKPGFPT